MTATSGTAKFLALSFAVALHGAILWGMTSGETPVEIEGAAGSTDVAIGSSFADLAVGTQTAQETLETVEPLEVVQPEPLAEPLETQPQETVETALLAPPVEPTPPVEATPVTPEVQPETATVEPVEPVVPAAPEPVETLEALDEALPSVSRSTRPKLRSESFEKQHKAKPVKRAETPKKKQPKKKAETKKKQPKQQKKATKKTAQTKGNNAKKNTKAGSAQGTKKSKKKSAQSGSGKKKASGNAAASNYPGKVMRKISRVSKPRVGSKGTAVVAFTIASNGGLAGVSIARSSGSSQLDQAALRVIRKAAPFPKPPAGAKRNFSIKIKGR